MSSHRDVADARGHAAAKSPKHQAVRAQMSLRDLCASQGAMSKLTAWRVVSASRRWHARGASATRFGVRPLKCEIVLWDQAADVT